MVRLLSADWHLTDNPAEEYRWDVFKHLQYWVESQHPIKTIEIFFLGDLTDKKDRHSGTLVNRIVDGFCGLMDAGASIFGMTGNHDQPLQGPPFWSCLHQLRKGTDLTSGISWFTEPRTWNGMAMLPFAEKPNEAWAQIDFRSIHTALIHQTVDGATGNNGIVLYNPRMLDIPRGTKVYSGDIHTPQVIGNVTYVGAPHPVAFGDDYPCRMLQLDNDWNIEKVIKVESIQRMMLRIEHPDDLAKVKVKSDDQAKVRCKLSVTDIAQWPVWEAQINDWARRKGVILFTVEPEIQVVSEQVTEFLPEDDPEYIMRAFAEAEQLDDQLIAAGIKLLKDTLGV